jgi:hypothetical protein
MGFTTTALVAVNALIIFPYSYTAVRPIQLLYHSLYLVLVIMENLAELFHLYIYCQKYDASASTSSAMQQRLSSSYVATLLRVYFGFFIILKRLFQPTLIMIHMVSDSKLLTLLQLTQHPGL